MPTIIDSLLVTLGLDTKGFTEGAAEAERAQQRLKDSATKDVKAVGEAGAKAGASAQKVGKERDTQAKAEEKRQNEAERKAKARQGDQKKRTDSTIEGLKSIGLFAAGAVLGFETLKGAVEAYADTSGKLANLSRIAPTIGASVKEAGALGKAFEIVGGKAEDAIGDISKLGHAQYSVLMHNPDAMAGYARRLGVSLFDSKTGQQRDKVAIMKDIGDALRKQTSDVQAQAMYAREMGLSEAAIQLFVVKTTAERDKALSIAEAANKADQKSADAARKQSESWSRIKAQVQGVKESIVGAIAPTITKITDALGDSMENAKGFKDPLSGLGIGGSRAGRDYKGADAPYAADFSAAEKKYGLPHGLLAAIASRESHFNPNAQATRNGQVTGQGLMQLNPTYFKGAGKSTTADINTAAGELHTLYAKYRKMYPEKQALALAVAHYNGGTRVDNALSGKIDPKTHKPTTLRDETKSYVPNVLGDMNRNAAFAAGASAPAAGGGTKPPGGGPGAGGGGQNVHIDEINIVTAATDANGIASTIAPAVQRKGVVAQANGGLQ